MANQSKFSALPEIIKHLSASEKVQSANALVIDRLIKSEPRLVDIQRAGDCIPGMTPETFLHAGPPIAFKDMCGPMRGAVAGGIIYEGFAKDFESAIKLAESGAITFSPNHEHGAVGPMSGVITPSMPVQVVQNQTFGNIAFSPITEGSRVSLQQGAYQPDVINNLRYIQTEFAPLLQAVLQKRGGLDISTFIRQSLHMGDEGHTRNKAATSLFLLEIVEPLLEICDKATFSRAFQFIANNQNYFVNTGMAACKSSLDSARNIDFSTIVSAMSRNGVEFGLQVCGMPDDAWFTGPAQAIMGLLYEGFSPADRNLDLGDSSIMETFGLGGFAMTAAPAIVESIGGSLEDAINCSARMYEITDGLNPRFSIPSYNFKGTPLGINVLKVAHKKILPILNTSIAHRQPGIGRIGAGLVTPPFSCFETALVQFYETYANRL